MAQTIRRQQANHWPTNPPCMCGHCTVIGLRDRVSSAAAADSSQHSSRESDFCQRDPDPRESVTRGLRLHFTLPSWGPPAAWTLDAATNFQCSIRTGANKKPFMNLGYHAACNAHWRTGLCAPYLVNDGANQPLANRLLRARQYSAETVVLVPPLPTTGLDLLK